MRKLKRRKISDKEFFTSPELKKHFEDLILAITRRTSPRIRAELHWDPPAEIGMTNGVIVHANTAYKAFDGMSREDRYRMCYGIIVHEIGHLLFSDFALMDKVLYEQEYIKFFEDYPETLKTERIGLALDRQFANLLREFENCLEDGFIENALKKKFEGLPGVYLRILRNFFGSRYPSVKEAREQCLSKCDCGSRIVFYHDMILAYATTGYLDFSGCDKDDEGIKNLRRMLPVIDAAVVEPDALKRWKATFRLLMIAWKDVEDFIKSREPMEHGGESDMISDGTATSKPEKAPDDLKDDRPDRGKMPEKEKDPDDGLGDKPDDATREDPDELHGDAGDLESESTLEGGPENTDESDNPEKGVKGTETDESDEECNGAASDTPDDGSEEDVPFTPDDTKALGKVLADICERKDEEDNEKTRKDDARSLIGASSHGDFGSVPITPKKAESGTYYSSVYSDLLRELKPISKRMQKTLLNELADRERGSKRAGLQIGKRFEAKDAHRKDLKVFSNRTAPKELHNLAVEVLCDLSGSMSACGRVQATQKMAILVQDFCSGLGFPCAVLGHTATHSGVQLITFCEWSDRDRESMGSMEAMADNQDGAALRYGLKRLLRRPEPHKLMIYISDGVPLNTSFRDVYYYGPEANQDVKDFVKEAEKAGIMLLCCGIGADKDTLKELYGDHFMDISDLNRLPCTLVKFLKRQILAAV